MPVRKLRQGRRPYLAAALLLAMAGIVPAGVRAQSDDTLLLMNRLNDLEAQVQQLNRRAGTGGGSASGAYNGMTPGAATGGGAAGTADLDVRLSQLQEQVRNLTGEIETQSNQIAQMRTESQRLNEDMQMRLNNLEAKTGGGPPAGTTGAAPATGVGSSMYGAEPTPLGPQQATASQSGTLGTTLVPGPDGAVPSGAAGATPEKEYEAAYNQLGQGDYAGAETGFNEFLQRHPKHPLAANAQYWLGETYFQRGMMDKAAVTFAQSYKQYPNGAKAPDSLLRLGMSLGQQGKTKQACVAFGELAKQFPATSQKIKASVAQEKARYACE